jgi:phosphopantothenoylcysteine decarboxylase
MPHQVVVGVSGGIAAYKTAMLVSQLVQTGLEVRVVMTESSEQFVAPATFAALTGTPVAQKLFDDARYPLGAHTELAEGAQVLCIAPATANFLAKASHGLADDLLSTLYLAFSGRVVMAPAMNQQMWSQPAVQRNVRQLAEDGVVMINPEEGWLSCRQKGPGRMAGPDTILSVIQRELSLNGNR